VRTGVRDDRDLGRHREEVGDAVARLDPERDERLREARHPLGKLPVGEPMALAVLRLPGRGRNLGRPLGPAVHAVPGEVELPADEPGRPLRPARKIHDAVPRLRELESHVVDRSRPEPLGIPRREALQLAIVVEAQPPHQAEDVRLLEHFLRWPPDDLHLARSVVLGNLARV
jgi:hypothetical protein